MKRLLSFSFSIGLFFASSANAAPVWNSLAEAIVTYKKSIDECAKASSKAADLAKIKWDALRNSNVAEMDALRKKINDLSKQSSPGAPPSKEMLDARIRLGDLTRMLNDNPLVDIAMNGTKCDYTNFLRGLTDAFDSAMSQFKKLDNLTQKGEIKALNEHLGTLKPGSEEYQRLLSLINQMQTVAFGL